MAQIEGPPGYGGFRHDPMRPMSSSIGMGIGSAPGTRPPPVDPNSIGMPLYNPNKHMRPSNFEDAYGGPANP